MKVKVISLTKENPALCRAAGAMWNIFNIVVSAPIWIYFAHMFILVDRSEIDLAWVKSDLNVSARMWTKIDLNESEINLKECEIDLNECEHFLKANLDWDRSRDQDGSMAP